MYDPLNRLTGAFYSTGERFEYAYDGVGNRTAMTDTLGTHTYAYDAANRLTSVDGVPYTWDARGNLVGDGTFTYAYNGAGRLVRAESVTATLVYTYNAAGLRVAQSADGDVTTFAWDTALPLAQVLATLRPDSGQASDGTLDLYGLGRIGEERDGEWAYPLPDVLGSVRQWTDGGGVVTYAGGYTPYGVEMWQAGSATSAWGYTGEWHDASVRMLYLRARWYDGQVGRFVRRDPWMGDIYQPPTLVQNYAYVRGNPIRLVDPTGMTEQWWEDMLRDSHWRRVFLDSASRHNSQAATGFTDEGFGAILASVVLIEGGNLGGASGGWKGLIGEYLGPRPEKIRVPIVACIKWLEIAYNRKISFVSPVGMEGSSIWEYLRHQTGYQSEGIVNVDRDVVEQARRAGVEIYYYDTDEIYSGLNWPLLFWRGQEQWIEYLAASFELVTKGSQELGVDLSAKNEHDWSESIRAFAQWHDRGIVKAFGNDGNWYGDEELADIERSNPGWVAQQRADQQSANEYYRAVTGHWWAALTGLTE